MLDSAIGEDLETALEANARAVARTTRVGVDAVHIPTWNHQLELGGSRLIERTYRGPEIAFCDGRAERLATRFAAKEAVLKCLGTGVRGIGLIDVEIVSEPAGRPTVRLHEPAAVQARSLGIGNVEVSLCHEEDFALAVAIGIEEAR